MLTSGTSGGAAPTYTIIPGEGVNYLTLRVQFYANECKEGETLTPNPKSAILIIYLEMGDGKEPTTTINQIISDIFLVKKIFSCSIVFI